MNRSDEQRRATERDSQTNAANERMSQTEQAQREQEQQARQLAERHRRRPSPSGSAGGGLGLENTFSVGWPTGPVSSGVLWAAGESSRRAGA